MPKYITQHRRGTSERINAYNGVIYDGELVIERCDDGTTKLRVGDGVTKCKDLPYIGAGDNASQTYVDEKINLINQEISSLYAQLEDALYEEIEITSFTNNTGTVELGSTLNSLALSWVLSKDPESQTVNGTTISKELRQYSPTGLTSTTTFTLTATDERGAQATKTTSVYFLNGVYYGTIASDTELDSSVILGLTKKLQSSKSITFTTTAGENEHIVFALPQRYGTPTFTVGGFEGGFSLKSSVQFTNGSGYTEAYNVWYSNKTNLGSTKVVVT